MLRLFTGLSIPKDISSEIISLRGSISGARWIEEADLHLTLQFIGNIEEPVAEELHDELLRIRKPPIEVILDGLHVFGGVKPRSIVIAVRPTPGLRDMHAAQERILRRLAIPYDARKFVPHVTLARLKGTPANVVADFLNIRGYFRPRSFMAEKFFLYLSPKKSGGGPYSKVSEFELSE